METPDAREWGRRQAESAPVWTEEKWRRAAAILGVELVDQDQPAEPVDTVRQAAA